MDTPSEMEICTHTQAHINKPVTDTEKYFSALNTPKMLTDTHRHPTPKTFFPAEVADANASP